MDASLDLTESDEKFVAAALKDLCCVRDGSVMALCHVKDRAATQVDLAYKKIYGHAACSPMARLMRENRIRHERLFGRRST